MSEAGEEASDDMDNYSVVRFLPLFCSSQGGGYFFEVVAYIARCIFDHGLSGKNAFPDIHNS